MRVLKGILVGDVTGVAGYDDLAVLDENGLIAILLDGAHAVRDENHRLAWIVLHLLEEVIAFLLEGLVTDRKHLVQYEDVALGLDRHGERETHLHAAGVVLELLVHEVGQFGEFNDIVIHRVDLLTRETEQRAIQIHVLAAGQFRVETDAELDEGDQCAANGDIAFFRDVDAGDDLEQRRLAGAVSADDAEEIALAHIEGDVAQHLLLAVAFDALGPVEERLLQAARLFGGQAEGFGDM